jgi:DNA-binding transcriptional MerR regulator
MSMASVLTIGQLAKATGVSARTIRFYEQVGALPPPGRSATGYRQYPPETADRLTFLRRARSLGLSLRELPILGDAVQNQSNGSFRPRLRTVVRTHLAVVHKQLEDLRTLQSQLEEVLRHLEVPDARAAGRRRGQCDCLDVQAGAR